MKRQPYLCFSPPTDEESEVGVLFDRDPPEGAEWFETYQLPERASHQRYDLAMRVLPSQRVNAREILFHFACKVVDFDQTIDHRSGVVVDPDGKEWIGVLSRNPADEVVVRLMPYQESTSAVMSADHPRFEEFLARLEGSEGVDYKLRAFGAPSRLKFDVRMKIMEKAQKVLKFMGLDASDEWTFYEKYIGNKVRIRVR